MFEYILITYNGEEIDKQNCYRFKSNYEDCDIDPYGDHVPFSVGSNQVIRHLIDSPINSDGIKYID